MKLIHCLYIAPLAFLAACSSEETAMVAVPDCENVPIELSAGIMEGPQDVVTRAENEDRHAKHLPLTSGTKLALQISGTWTGHGTVPATDPDLVYQTTTGTIGAETSSGSKHNAVTCSPVLYWDDYGTADANNTTGRADGLTIYGVAIDGKSTAPTVNSWTALSWTLTADQTTTGNTPADKDLLISNNVKGTALNTPYDGNYRFADYYAASATYTKLLEFKHAMSKITVNLKAGTGFVGAAFDATTPEEVTLVNKEGTTVATDSWACTTGTVDITTGTVTLTGSPTGTPAVITMYQASTAATGYDITKEALVMPKSAFASDDAIIARINADNNIYYVTAEKIRAAALLKGHTEETGGAILTKAGYNYIINVIVNMTEIKVTATVTEWTDVPAAVVEPVINIGTSYGVAPNSETEFAKTEFSFYRRTSAESMFSLGLTENDYYKEIRRAKKNGSDWTLNISNGNDVWMRSNLYWPDHNTHYQFRGVWPVTGTGTETGVTTYPRVEAVNGSQVIKVKNVPYVANSFPSDLQIGRPDVATNATCTNNEAGHTTTNLWSGGICATEGKINLKFMYMMSQVEVNLTTNDGGLDKVRLENAKVELVNVHKTGNVTLDDRTVTPTGVASATPVPATDTFGDYILDNYTYTAASGGNPSKANYRSAIVPQQLTYTDAQAAGNVKFRITITNDDNTTDVYYADIAPIKKSGSTTEYVAKAVDTDNDGEPDEWYWESGYHYIYNLKLTKTEVKVTATLADWTPVTAAEDVWF